MHEHELIPERYASTILDELVDIAAGGETVELLRNGTTVAVLVGIEDYDALVSIMEAAGHRSGDA